MQKRKRKIILCVLAFLLLTGGSAIGQGKWINKKINVFYNNLTVYIDGQRLDTPVEPFIYEGHTMVPLRALGEAMGKSVAWEAESGRIIIGEAPVSQAPPAKLTDLTVLRNVGDFYEKSGGFVITKQRYENGIAADLDKGSRAEFIVELAGKYQELTGFVGVDDSTQDSSGAFYLTISGDGRVLYGPTKVLPGQYPIKMKLGVEKMETVKFNVEWVQGGVGDYTPVLAAIANFKVQ